MRERRRQVADDLYQALVSGGYSFWEHIHPLFLARDITRHDMRELVRRGLRRRAATTGRCCGLFRMGSQDYKRFLNFLAAHECKWTSANSGTARPCLSVRRGCSPR